MKKKFMYPKADIYRRYVALFMHLGAILRVPGFFNNSDFNHWENTPVIFNFLSPHLFQDNKKLYKELNQDEFKDMSRVVFEKIYSPDDLIHLINCCALTLKSKYNTKVDFHIHCDYD